MITGRQLWHELYSPGIGIIAFHIIIDIVMSSDWTTLGFCVCSRMSLRQRVPRPRDVGLFPPETRYFPSQGIPTRRTSSFRSTSTGITRRRGAERLRIRKGYGGHCCPHGISGCRRSHCGQQTCSYTYLQKLSKGFCYVILFLPPMGDGSYFGSDRPGQSSCE